jgi:thymidylate synthase (FAD)
MSLNARNPYMAKTLDFSEITPEERLELQRWRQVQELRRTTFGLLPGPDGKHQGFVRLVNVLGSDDSAVETARLTAQSEGKGFDDDRNLLRYLMRHLHTTPLEFGEIVLHVRVPMDCWRQWIRHRTASVNEYSTRYSEAIDAQAKTPPNAWRLQSQSNRQGSSGAVVEDWPAESRHFGGVTPGQYLSQREAAFHVQAQELYSERLAFGVAKEVARKDLPLSTFTEAYWKCDMHNLLHFLALRMDSHAQKEIRDYATVIGEQIVAKLFPYTWEAFLDYRLHAMQLTRLDVEVIRRMAQGAVDAAAELATTTGFADNREPFSYIPPYSAWVFKEYQDPSWATLKRCRERVECWAKLERLGLVKLKEGEEPIV